MSGKREQDEQLFTPDEVAPKVTVRRPKDQIWTRNKALLIERYLYYFIRVTGHGTYIDGFAAPQKPDEPEAWSARRVIESQPDDRRRRRLQHFHLFELDRQRFQHLIDLRDGHPRKDIQVYRGDFNERVAEILRPSVLKKREATFVLLDQYAHECDWATVERLAGYSPSRAYKLELFYFLPSWWFKRSRNISIEKALKWWGRDDWEEFFTTDNAYDRAFWMQERFEELGYKDVKAWPIFSSEHGSGIAYFMIHATDHPRAPVLMRSAYEDAVRPPKDNSQLAMELGVDPEELRD